MPDTSSDAPKRRSLVYRGPSRGQGIGSHMRGVAAALLLGEQYDRLVCVHWQQFQQAFHNPKGCPKKAAYFTAPTLGGSATTMLNATLAFELWTFDGTDAVPSKLLTGSEPVVVMSGDGGSVVSDDVRNDGDGEEDEPGTAAARRVAFPFEIKDELHMQLIAPQRVVAHLRVGDAHEHHKRGIFSAHLEDGEGQSWLSRFYTNIMSGGGKSSTATATPKKKGKEGGAANNKPLNATEALRTALPKDAYVLSDSPDVYKALCDAFLCPPWRALAHSAERANTKMDDKAKRLQTLQTWADWWMIRTTRRQLLATPSRFATSALRFNERGARYCQLTDQETLEACAEHLGDVEPGERGGGGLHMEL